MREHVRRRLEESARAVEAATLVWIDLAGGHEWLCKEDVRAELNRRWMRNERYPRPNELEIAAGFRSVVRDGVLVPGNYFHRSNIYDDRRTPPHEALA